MFDSYIVIIEQLLNSQTNYDVINGNIFLIKYNINYFKPPIKR